MKENEAIRMAKKYFHWWCRWLGLNYGEVNILYYDYIEDNIDGEKIINTNCAGRCHTDWRYQKTTIEISIKRISSMSEREIEECVVHELMHVFLNEMREEEIDHEERVATNLQKAFMWVREGVRDGK